MAIILGIDDAGRGPLIGPMILAGVLVNKDQEKIIKKAGVKDSKLLQHYERIKLAQLIRKNSISYKVVKTSPEEIDISLKTGTNLNKLEAKLTAKIINFLNAKEIKKQRVKLIVDCPSVNTSAWKRTL